MKSTRFRASVGHVADFVHASGDLGGRGGPMVRPIEGLRRQQAHQARYGKDHRREVALEASWRQDDIELVLAGRADGIDLSGTEPVVEEIKTYRGDLESLRAQRGGVHDAQVALYGALFSRGRKENTLKTRVRYVHADDDSWSDVERCWSSAELETFFTTTCSAYVRWLQAEAGWRQARNASLAELSFPYGGFRAGQRPLAAAVWRALGDGKPLLAEAPTGIGKTIAVLFGALRRLPEMEGTRLLYLTARGPGRASALAASARLISSGAALRVLDLRARDLLCLEPDTPCSGQACRYARGYFDRRRNALQALLWGEEQSTPGIIDLARVRDVARRHCVCPVALQHDAARWCDVIVADMNHGFDPIARQRVLLDPQEGGAAILIDEAHNLEERARDMLSARLEAGALRELAVGVRTSAVALARRLLRLAHAISACHGGTTVAALEPVAVTLERVLPELNDWLGRAPAGGLYGRCRETYGCLLRFWLIWQEALASPDAWWAHGHRVTGGDHILLLRCLAPANALARDHARSKALVLFSATLPSACHMQKVLGLPDTARSVRLGSPFPPERQQVLLVRDLDLRMSARERSTPALARLIVDLAASRPGHHLVFLPSYAFLERVRTEVAERLRAVLPDAECLVQRPGMTDDERASFLRTLSDPDGRTRIAFAISGGLFGEGVDLIGDKLLGVVVAGLPMPPPDVERKAIGDYHGPEGFEIAFRTPAITRLLQAAGRLIRSERDVGTLCLVDHRLAQSGYRRRLPSNWIVSEIAAAEVADRVQAFWADHAATSERRDCHAQDEDHLHHRAGDGELSHAGKALPGGDERGAAQHVPRRSRVRTQGDQLDSYSEPEGALSSADPARYAGAGDSHRGPAQ